MNNLQDTPKTIFNQFGIDIKEKMNPNPIQNLLMIESELGNITSEELDKAIDHTKEDISEITDPKILKEENKKLENLRRIAERSVKPLNMDLENKWKSYFTKVDSIIKNLDDKLKIQLLSNVYINENPKWHPERNSLIHIKIVTSRAISTKDKDLIDSAIFHDIAKFDTVSINSQGWPTSLGHDRKGAESAKDHNMNDIVVYICANHMKIKGWIGDSEGGTLNPSTKFNMFNEAPGTNLDEKAKAFWKLILFTKMDNMDYDFDYNKLKWDNPTYENWHLECPLKDEYKKDELVEIKQEKPTVSIPFSSQEIIKFGAKGSQIGQINKAIVNKTKEEALQIIKDILGDQNLKLEKKWIMTFENFSKKKKKNK